jgi:hypothetical protein
VRPSRPPNPLAGVRLLLWLLAAHAGLAVIAALAVGLPTPRAKERPTVDRAPVDPDGRYFIYFFALAPAAAMTVFVMLIGGPAPLLVAPLAVLSGLALMAAAPDRLRLVHQRLAGYAWAALVILPPLLAIGAVTALPWIYRVDLAISEPAAEMGRFFGESFQRRTGRPLAVVAGDERIAALIAVSAPSRPALYLDAAPERTPWVKPQDISSKGAVIVWLTADTTGAPPAAIKARFPDLVPDVPRAFARPVQGRLPLMRVGWGLIRPRSALSEPQAPPQPIAQPQPPPEPPPPPQVQSQPPPQAQPQPQPQTQPQQRPQRRPPQQPQPR